MFDGSTVAQAFLECGITHVVWIPDSATGAWEHALSDAPGLSLVRVCREGEAFAVASGLQLGGKRPIVQIQCTGLFEAGDSLRNCVHDLGVPLFLLVGLRNYYAWKEGKSGDTAPRFAEAILQAWGIPFVVFDRSKTLDDLKDEYLKATAAQRAFAVFLAE